MPYIGAQPDKGNFADLNGAKLILDADADTSITADTDDQIDIEISGANDFKFAANAFNVLSGSTLTIDSGATIANSGTATGFSSADPSSADGDTLGTASLEWSDLYLADGGVIYFGNDQDVKVTHDPDDGLFLKSTATADNNPFVLTLQTGETDMAADDVLGKIAFQAPDEGTGTDAILVAAAIQARSEGNFAADANATSIDFMTGSSEAAATKMTLSSAGGLTVTPAAGGAAVFNEGGVAADFRVETDNHPLFMVINGTLDRWAHGIAPSVAYGWHYQPDSLASWEGSTLAMVEMDFGNSQTFKASESVTNAIGLNLQVPAWVLNSGSVTNTATLRVAGADTVGTNNYALWVDAGESRFDESIFVNDTLFVNETANGDMTTGLTINQGAADDSILALKSSDVAHGVTTLAETDTYFSIKKASGSEGGTLIYSIQESSNDNQYLKFVVVGADANNTHTTGGRGAMNSDMAVVDGTGTTAHNSGSNIWTAQNNTVTAFIITAEGNFYYNGADGGAFDTVDDIMLLRDLQMVQHHRHEENNCEFHRGGFKSVMVETPCDPTDLAQCEANLVTHGIMGEVTEEHRARCRAEGLDDNLVGLISGPRLANLHSGAHWQSLQRQLCTIDCTDEVIAEIIDALVDAGIMTSGVKSSKARIDGELATRNQPNLPAGHHG